MHSRLVARVSASVTAPLASVSFVQRSSFSRDDDLPRPVGARPSLHFLSITRVLAYDHVFFWLRYLQRDRCYIVVGAWIVTVSHALLSAQPVLLVIHVVFRFQFL